MSDQVQPETPDRQPHWPDGTQLLQYRWFDPRRGMGADPVIAIRTYLCPDTDPIQVGQELKHALSEMLRALYTEPDPSTKSTLANGESHGNEEEGPGADTNP